MLGIISKVVTVPEKVAFPEAKEFEVKEICETRFGAEEKYKLFPFELIVKPKRV